MTAPTQQQADAASVEAAEAEQLAALAADAPAREPHLAPKDAPRAWGLGVHSGEFVPLPVDALHSRLVSDRTYIASQWAADTTASLCQAADTIASDYKPARCPEKFAPAYLNVRPEAEAHLAKLAEDEARDQAAGQAAIAAAKSDPAFMTGPLDQREVAMVSGLRALSVTNRAKFDAAVADAQFGRDDALALSILKAGSLASGVNDTRFRFIRDHYERNVLNRTPSHIAHRAEIERFKARITANRETQANIRRLLLAGEVASDPDALEKAGVRSSDPRTWSVAEKTAYIAAHPHDPEALTRLRQEAKEAERPRQRTPAESAEFIKHHGPEAYGERRAQEQAAKQEAREQDLRAYLKKKYG